MDLIATKPQITWWMLESTKYKEWPLLPEHLSCVTQFHHGSAQHQDHRVQVGEVAVVTTGCPARYCIVLQAVQPVPLHDGSSSWWESWLTPADVLHLADHNNLSRICLLYQGGRSKVSYYIKQEEILNVFSTMFAITDLTTTLLIHQVYARETTLRIEVFCSCIQSAPDLPQFLGIHRGMEVRK